MRVLVVDDDPSVVNILSSELKQYGHEVDEAHDGIEAVECLQNNSYDVAIIDAMMPRMKGVEVCRFIKSKSPTTYIIGISGYPDSLKKLKNGGADICFTKPFNARACIFPEFHQM
jgi:two-component system alkaline phosphatase synthesis response regulator PhoP